MSDEQSYMRRYARFFQERKNAHGYDFHHAPSGSVPVPKVTFMQSLRWWSWDRWKRLKTIRAERDRRQEEILQLKAPTVQKSHQNSDDAGSRIAWDPPTG